MIRAKTRNSQVNDISIAANSKLKAKDYGRRLTKLHVELVILQQGRQKGHESLHRLQGSGRRRQRRHDQGTSTADYFIRAYDIADGRQLWEDRLPAGGQSRPMTYAVDGR